jgi:hypothetical protein
VVLRAWRRSFDRRTGIIEWIITSTAALPLSEMAHRRLKTHRFPFHRKEPRRTACVADRNNNSGDLCDEQKQ